MGEQNLRQRAYEHVQRKIVAGELRSGQVVSEQSLATELGISRTPVREAIRQLEHCYDHRSLLALDWLGDAEIVRARQLQQAIK